MKLLIIPVFLLSLQSSVSEELQNKRGYCTTASCVHAAAVVLDKLNTEIDPCEDFYDYACGNFASDLGVPDEKATIDTLSFVKERVLEYILTFVDPVKATPVDEKASKSRRLSRKFYNSCRNKSKKFHFNSFGEILCTQNYFSLDQLAW